jgi:hypothetical protein
MGGKSGDFAGYRGWNSIRLKGVDNFFNAQHQVFMRVVGLYVSGN